MANELTVVDESWLAVASQFKDMPMPFDEAVFLAECHLAGTDEVDDLLVRVDGVEAGAPLVLRRTPADADDARAVAVLTKSDALIGYLPRRYSALMARLMDAGKFLSGKLVRKELMGHWLDVVASIEMKDFK